MTKKVFSRVVILLPIRLLLPSLMSERKIKSDLSLVIPYSFNLWCELEWADIFRLEQFILEKVIAGKQATLADIVLLYNGLYLFTCGRVGMIK